MRYNNISSPDIDFLVGQLRRNKNQTLLFVELSGNKIKKQTIDALETILRANRSKNPTTKDKLKMVSKGGFGQTR